MVVPSIAFDDFAIVLIIQRNPAGSVSTTAPRIWRDGRVESSARWLRAKIHTVPETCIPPARPPATDSALRIRF